MAQGPSPFTLIKLTKWDILEIQLPQRSFQTRNPILAGPAEASVNRLTFGPCAAILLCVMPSNRIFAQSVCDQGNGPLDPTQPRESRP